jgi:WG containing repeat
MYPRKDHKTGRYGYRVRDGWAIQPQFGYANNFVNGHAAVDLLDGRRAFLRPDGTLLSLKEICGGRTPVQTDWSAPDCFCFSGFHYFESQSSRYMTVRTEIRRRRAWGLIDTSLAYIPLPDEVFAQIDQVQPYGEYLIVRRSTGRAHESLVGLFNIRTMRLEVPLDEICIHPSLELIWVLSRGWHSDNQSETLRFAFYDVSKQEFLSDWFRYALPFSEGFGAIRDDSGFMYFVDRNLQPAFEAQFGEVDRFSYGLAAVYDRSDSGYLDTSGQMRLLLPHYDRLQPFNEFGLAIANRDDANWDLDIIDRTGHARLKGFETAVFWEGDFPYFQVSKGDEELLFDIELNRIS